MKVVYRSTLEWVNEVICAAKEDSREIDYIELTPAEWYAFYRDLGTHPGFEYYRTTSIMYKGVTIKQTKSPSTESSSA